MGRHPVAPDFRCRSEDGCWLLCPETTDDKPLVVTAAIVVRSYLLQSSVGDVTGSNASIGAAVPSALFVAVCWLI